MAPFGVNRFAVLGDEWFSYAGIVVGLIILPLSGAYFLYLIVRGGDLLVTFAGIADGLGNRTLGLLTWEKISEVSLDSNSKTVIIKLKDSQKDILIDLEYYRIDGDELVEIIRKNLDCHRRREVVSNIERADSPESS